MVNVQKLKQCRITVGQYDGQSVLQILPPGVACGPGINMQQGEVAIGLTFDCGVSWPDRAGLQLLSVAIEEGGVAILVFATLGDALACQMRLRRLMEATT